MRRSWNPIVAEALRVVRAAGTTMSLAMVLGIASAGERPTVAPVASGGAVDSLMSIEPISSAMSLEETRAEPTGLTPALRARGYNPCYMPDPGFGAYSHWQNLSTGQMIVPLRGGHTEDGGYDVIIHFHGHEAVRHSFVEVARGAVLVGIDMGASSGPYEHAFQDEWRFTTLLQSINRGLVKHSGNPNAHIRHLALSSWSAGYGAVNRILARFGSAIDALVLLDSLHASYVDGPYGDALHHVFTLPLSPALSIARRAARGDAIMFLSHSQIVPPGYASTTEVADYLLDQVTGVRSAMYGTTPLGATLQSGYDREGLHVRGYAGGDKAAHCMHVELLAEAVRDYLEPAWQTPPAERP